MTILAARARAALRTAAADQGVPARRVEPRRPAAGAAPTGTGSSGIEVELGTAVAELDLEAGEALAEDGRAWRFERCLLATGARPLVPDAARRRRPRRAARSARSPTPSSSRRSAGNRVLRRRLRLHRLRGGRLAGDARGRGDDGDAGGGPAARAPRRAGRRERIAAWLRGAAASSCSPRRSWPRSRAEASGASRPLRGRPRARRRRGPAGARHRPQRRARRGRRGRGRRRRPRSTPRWSPRDPRLLAAGDVAFAENAAAGRRLRVEHWGEALNQGEIAGRTLAGVEARWDVAPGFWSTIGERTLKYAGWGDGWDEVRFEPGEGERLHRLLRPGRRARRRPRPRRRRRLRRGQAGDRGAGAMELSAALPAGCLRRRPRPSCGRWSSSPPATRSSGSAPASTRSPPRSRSTRPPTR